MLRSMEYAAIGIRTIFVVNNPSHIQLLTMKNYHSEVTSKTLAFTTSSQTKTCF